MGLAEPLMHLGGTVSALRLCPHPTYSQPLSSDLLEHMGIGIRLCLFTERVRDCSHALCSESPASPLGQPYPALVPYTRERERRAE